MSTEGPVTFLIPGEEAFSAAGRSRDGGIPGAAEHSPYGPVKHAARVGVTRAGAPLMRVNAQPGEDVVVLEIAQGPELVLHPSHARDLLLAQGLVARGRAGGGEPDAVPVPVRLAWPGLSQAAARGSRGLGDVVLAGVKIVAADKAQDALAGLAADALVARFDGQVDAGLYRLQKDRLEPLRAPDRLDVAPLRAGGKPLLVLVHGTFSSTEGTFKQLWRENTPLVRGLFAHYEDHVYALDHPTLSVSPIANALALAQALPQGAVLHLLTHSRGGLVAEVLARACASPALTADDLAFFAPATLAAQREALVELAQVVQRKGLRVERVVRVACPARGTLLASKRLDAWLSVFKWTLQLGGLPVLPALVSFLGEVARQRMDPTRIPGLAAQMPESPELAWIHAVDKPLDGGLRVVAGDSGGGSLGLWLSTLVADAFFRTDNDLVVHTSAMYGGAPRADGALFMLDQGDAVSHFAYFKNPDTAQALTDALRLDAPPQFRPIGLESWAGRSSTGVRGQRAASAPHKPAVVLLPGIVGSHLRAGDKRIWLAWRLVGGLARLAYTLGQTDDVDPDGLMGPTYEDLATYLGATHDVIEFDYDWRQPIEAEADRLAQAVDAAMKARAETGQPVRLLAHSMGGLVARVMQLQQPAVWDQMMRHPRARVVMLGTPNGGSWAPMQVLSGDDTFGNLLSTFGSLFREREARQVMAGMPGLMQLQAGLMDAGLGLQREETWRELARRDLDSVREHSWWHVEQVQVQAYTWGVPTQPVLDAAVRLRQRLDQQQLAVLPDYADRMAIVLGRARRTPDGFSMGAEGLVYQDAVDQGDGRVMDRSAVISGVRTWRAAAEHGALAKLAAAFPAYLDLLDKGETERLPVVAWRSRGGAVADAGQAVPVQHVPSRPSRQMPATTPPSNAQDVLTSPETAWRAEPAVRPLGVEVVNGHLGFVRQPLLVGHYTALRLGGTEAAMARLMGRRVLRELATGLYPQEPGAQKIFVNTAPSANPLQLPRPEAVIVVGLGPEGNLRPGDLKRAAKQGVLAWAMRLAEQPGHPPSFEIAATLVGSGGIGITPGQAAQQIAQGVNEANKRLAEISQAEGDAPDHHAPCERRSGPPPLPMVDRLILVELYLDRATEAWRAVQVLQAASPGCFALHPVIDRVTGAMTKPPDAGYRGANYDLIIATTHEDEYGNKDIAYRLDTRRARTEITAQATQSRLLAQLIDGGTGRGGCCAGQEVGPTLFKLLVPQEMEPFLGGSTETQIEVDDYTATIPWELLDPPPRPDEPTAEADLPWAIRTKLLRKLRMHDFRAQVRDAAREAGVLIIGEPACDRAYERLPGARREARSVLERFHRARLTACRVQPLIASDDQSVLGANACTVIDALLGADWRIVHIAGHGEPPLMEGPKPERRGDPPQKLVEPRGVVLSDKTFLGPREIRNMRTVPELVFLNCCFSGVTAGGDVRGGGAFSRPAFAASVAEQLIGLGVRCVVVTGWAVNDEAAERFASAFYESLLRGRRFMDAVAEARRAAWVPGDATWGAYQCYGDPDWRFQAAPADADAPEPPVNDPADNIASVPALILALERAEVQAADISTSQRPVIEALEQRFGTLWGRRGDVAEAFARAWRAIDAPDAARRWFEQAVRAGDGTASFRAMEGLHNLNARSAWTAVTGRQRQATRSRRNVEEALAQGHAAPDSPALQRLRGQVVTDEVALCREALKAASVCKRALTGLRALNALQPTAERERLCGAVCKRLLQARRQYAGPGVDMQWLADQMMAHYHRAWTMAQEDEEEGEAFHAAMNVLAARWLARGEMPAELLDDVRRLIEQNVRRAPDFWGVAAGIEVSAWEAYARGELAQRLPALLQSFEDLHNRVSAIDKWESVHEQMRFIAARPPLADDDAEGEPAALARLLDRLERFVIPCGDAF